MRVVNYQYISLYGNKAERQLANKILNFHFKRLILSRKVDNEALSDYMKQGLPMSYIHNHAEARQLVRDIRKKRSPIVHFFKGLNIAQKDINKFFVNSLGALVFGTFLVILATITLLLVPVVPLN